MEAPIRAAAETELRSNAVETRRELARRGFVPVTVDGDCMEPTLRRGETVLVRRRRFPRVGDLALVDAQGALEIHRLVDRIEAGPRTWFVHLGDASETAGLANLDNIVGVIEGPARRRRPAIRAHAWGLALRLGAVLEFLGIRKLLAIFVESPRKSG